MWKFMVGLLSGFAFGVITATAMADGYMIGWTVTLDGTEICSDPFIWSSIKEIECDS